MKSLGVALALTLAATLAPVPATAVETDPVVLGRDLVQHLGCLFCHGLGGRKGIVNPNAERGYVPAWDEKEFIEKYPDPEKVKETIREGRFPDKAEGATGTPIPMPPWGNRLKDDEMDAIIAYMWHLRDTPMDQHEKGGHGAEAAREAHEPMRKVDRKALAAARKAEQDALSHHHDAPSGAAKNQAEHGRALVTHLGCMHCHGAGDQKSMENPNAKRKTIPAWDDPEFIRRYPIGDGIRYVIQTGRQPEADPDAEGTPVPMPPWGNRLSEDEMDKIVAYIMSLRGAGGGDGSGHATH